MDTKSEGQRSTGRLRPVLTTVMTTAGSGSRRKTSLMGKSGSGRGKKEYAKEAQTIAEAGPDGHPAEVAATNGAGEVAEEALVAL